MIRCGRLCRHCSGGVCRDKSTETEPVEVECPACDGRPGGCEACDDGHFAIAGCPTAFCQSMSGPLAMVDFLNKGILPVAGGLLDQSAWLVDAARFVAGEESSFNEAAT